MPRAHDPLDRIPALISSVSGKLRLRWHGANTMSHISPKADGGHSEFLNKAGDLNVLLWPSQ